MTQNEWKQLLRELKNKDFNIYPKFKKAINFNLNACNSHRKTDFFTVKTMYEYNSKETVKTWFNLKIEFNLI